RLGGISPLPTDQGRRRHLKGARRRSRTQERHYATSESSSCRYLQRLARKPSGATCVNGVKRWTIQARHVGANLLAGANQRVGKMAISFWVMREEFAVEL